MKQYRLTTKNTLDASKIIVFACKIFPFIRKNEKENYINELFDFAKNINIHYEKFNNYFKRAWVKSNFLQFDEICDGEIINRTNNICETFHHKINSSIEYPHPKLAILLEKLKIIIVNYYRLFINKLFNKEKNVNNSINLFTDIKNFLEKFLKKYDNNITIKLIVQEEGNLKNLFESISMNILKELYNFGTKINTFKDDSKEDEEKNLYCEDDNNVNDLIDN